MKTAILRHRHCMICLTLLQTIQHIPQTIIKSINTSSLHFNIITAPSKFSNSQWNVLFTSEFRLICGILKDNRFILMHKFNISNEKGPFILHLLEHLLYKACKAANEKPKISLSQKHYRYCSNQYKREETAEIIMMII